MAESQASYFFHLGRTDQRVCGQCSDCGGQLSKKPIEMKANSLWEGDLVKEVWFCPNGCDEEVFALFQKKDGKLIRVHPGVAVTPLAFRDFRGDSNYVLLRGAQKILKPTQELSLNFYALADLNLKVVPFAGSL